MYAQHLVSSPSTLVPAEQYHQNDETEADQHVASSAIDASWEPLFKARRLLKHINEAGDIEDFGDLSQSLKILSNDDHRQKIQNDLFKEKFGQVAPAFHNAAYDSTYGSAPSSRIVSGQYSNPRDSNISTNSSRSSSGSMLPPRTSSQQWTDHLNPLAVNVQRHLKDSHSTPGHDAGQMDSRPPGASGCITELNSVPLTRQIVQSQIADHWRAPRSMPVAASNTQCLAWNGGMGTSAPSPDEFMFERPSNPPSQKWSAKKPRKKIFKCTHCDAFYYQDWQAFLRHEAQYHDVATAHQCSHCHAQFRTVGDTREHHEQAHGGPCSQTDCYQEVLAYSLALVDGGSGALIDLTSWRYDPKKSANENSKQREDFLEKHFYATSRLKIPEHIQELTVKELSVQCSQIWKRSKIARGFLTHSMMFKLWCEISGGLDIESLNWNDIDPKHWSSLQSRWELCALVSDVYAAQAVAYAWRLINTVNNAATNNKMLPYLTAETGPVQERRQAGVRGALAGPMQLHANGTSRHVEDIGPAARKILPQSTATFPIGIQQQPSHFPYSTPILPNSPNAVSSSWYNEDKLDQSTRNDPNRMSWINSGQVPNLSPASMPQVMPNYDNYDSASPMGYTPIDWASQEFNGRDSF